MILARSDFVNVHSGWLSQRLLGGQIIVRNFIIFSVKNGNGSRKPLANRFTDIVALQAHNPNGAHVLA